MYLHEYDNWWNFRYDKERVILKGTLCTSAGKRATT